MVTKREYVYIETFEMPSRSNSRQHEQVRRFDRSSGQYDFFFGSDLSNCIVPLHFNAISLVAFHENLESCWFDTNIFPP